MVKDVAEANNLLDNLRTIVKSIRQAGIQVFIAPTFAHAISATQELIKLLPVPSE